MFKKLILVLTLVFFLFGFKIARAGIVINEIMYDLPGSDSTNSKSREWIEVYNSGVADVSIDASKWRFYDGGANRTINGEVNFIIPANSYMIFAGDKDIFLLDHQGFRGVVYDTGLTSLNNTTATLKILDQDGNIADEVAYISSQGGNGDANSLQKISSSWSGAAPTPGTANETTTSPPPSADNSSSNESSSSSASSSGNNVSSSNGNAKVAEIKKIKTHIITKTLGFVGLPISLDATALGLDGEYLHYGKYFWNFGDGDSKEINLADSQSFTHIYFYPGDYAVSLDYFSNPYIYSNIPDASDRIIIKIIGTDISISRVGDEKDFFVELSNNTDFSADLSNWFLASVGKSFKIPRNTVLASKKKMIISPKITNFSITDKDTLKLINSSGEVIFDYSASLVPVIPAKIVANNIVPVKLSKLSASETKSLNKNTTNGAISENIAENLLASANVTMGEEATVPQSNVSENNSDNSYLPILGSIIFIGVSASAVYFIRQKKVITQAGNDFEILDE